MAAMTPHGDTSTLREQLQALSRLPGVDTRVTVLPVGLRVRLTDRASGRTEELEGDGATLPSQLERWLNAHGETVERRGTRRIRTVLAGTK